MRRAALAGALAALLALPAAALSQHPGNAKMFIGTYGSDLLVIDEATGTVEDEIELETGVPYSMVLSTDRTRFYVLNTLFEGIEIVDVATRKSVDSFALSSGTQKVRIWGYNVDPQERYAILLAKTYDRKPDRYEVSGPLLLRYDLATHTVTDTIAWPGGEPLERARVLFSPDGEFLYFFADEILVLETEGFTEVDRWAYEEALGEGIGRFDFGFPEQNYEEPGYYTGIFRTTDPSQGRRLMGVARVNLVERDIEFFTLGPYENTSFALAPGGKKAYGLHQEVGNYQFWTFDLENRRVESRQRFDGRPRMSLMPSSSGEVLYIYGAGSTIDLYDAATYRFLRTIDLEIDVPYAGMYILPAPAAPATTDGNGGGR